MQTPHLRPDIQGLRGLAVLAVVLDHAFRWPVGGFLGVDVFFVISGFVIATGLLRERARSGSIRLGAFAVRRVRRLAPASLAVLVTTVTAAWFLLTPSRFGTVLTDALWSAGALQNWRLAAEGTDYFAATTVPSPFQHFWSLGVEEQFYLVLPVLMVVLLGRGTGRGRSRLTATALGVLVLVSVVWAFLAVSADPAAAYFSTATRAWELGLGVLVALAALRARGRSVRPLLGEGMVVVGLVAVTTSVLIGRESSGVPAPLALVPTVGTALVLLAGSGAGTGPRAAASLRWRPLVGLGTISYSLYLWHWPFILLLPLVAPVPMPVVVALALLTAIASHATLETVFRRPGLRRTLRENRLRVQLGGLAAVTVLTVVTTSFAAERVRPLPAVPAAAAAESLPAEDEAFPALRARARDVAAGAGARAWPADLTPSADAISASGYVDSLTKTSDWASTLGCSLIGADWRSDGCVWGPEDGRATDVLLTGDSTAAFSAPGWRALAEDSDARLRVRDGAQIGCPFSTTALPSDTESCAAHNAEVVDELERTKPELLVVTNRFWDEDDPSLESIAEDDYASGTRDMIAAVREHVGRVVVVPATPPGYAPVSCVAGTRGPQDCRSGDEVARTQIRALTGLLADVEDTTVLDSTPLWCAAGSCPLVIDSVLTRFDPVHTTPEASVASAPALLDLLRQEDVLPGVRRSSP